jgi:hypothetical protein
MSSKVTIVEAPRPDTQAGEDRIFLRAYREALTEISYILELPGSSSLTKDVVESARKMAKENARLKARVARLEAHLEGKIL